MKSRKFKVKTSKDILIQFSGSGQLKLTIQKYDLNWGWGEWGRTITQTLRISLTTNTSIA